MSFTQYFVDPSMGSLSVFALLSLVVVVVSASLQLFKRGPKLPPNLPVVQITNPGPNGIYEALTKAYDEYPDTPFVLNTARPTVILPGKLVDDVKALPESVASMFEEVRIDHCLDVTKVGGGQFGAELIPTLRVDLTRHTNGAIPALLDEQRFAVGHQFQECSSTTEWKPVIIHPKVTAISAMTLSRIFVGRPISRSPEWLRSSIGYAADIMRSRQALNKYPHWLQLIIGGFLPEVRQMRAHLENGKKILAPIVQKLVAEARGGGHGAANGDIKDKKSSLKEKQQTEVMDEEEAPEFDDQQGTFCSWILKYLNTTPSTTPEEIATTLMVDQLALSWVAVHSVSFGITRAIYDLCSRPEYVPALRQEIEDVIRSDGLDPDRPGDLRRESYVKLRKLDSFLKESLRLCPNKLVGMARLAMQPITLSTGHVLPPGTRFGIPMLTAHMSKKTEHSWDVPGVTAPCDEFDGFRFAKLRELPGNQNKYQMITAATDYLSWGGGTHVCPGRFFTSSCVKVLFVELLRKWDFRLVGDVEGKGGPPVGYRFNGFTLISDVSVPIEVKRREESVC